MPSIGTEALLRLTVSALLAQTGVQQRDLARALGLSPTQVSRRQSGQRSWSLDECDLLAAYWGLPVLDLLAGPTHAVNKLPAAPEEQRAEPGEAPS